MNMFTSQSGTPAWVSQFSDPNAWQALMKAPQLDMNPIMKTVADLGATIDPATLSKLQSDYMQQVSELWQDMLTQKTPTIADRRFAAPEWKLNPMFAFNAAAYLLNARFLVAMADAVQASARAKQKLRFAVQQMVDAMSPANFLVTNPEAQQKIIETKGESLARGIAHMLEDIQKGRISQTDESAFEVGRNVANTEGAVVFENELFQLIQYKALTKTVHERPLLLVPPCINKFYILDLQPQNSLVKYAVEQGHTVFLISWCNPDNSLAHTTWEDYILKGVLNAIDVAQEISGQEQINMLGFCVGGTILSMALALLAAKGENPAASLTLLTTLLDFADTGVIDVFIDETQVTLREQTIGERGLMPGRDFTSAFSSLRPNDLIWNYVASNYLKGEDPTPFDLLYWNADSTNLPGPMFCYYLRNMYLENKLKEPGALSIEGEEIDLGKIDAPTFIYGSREDHIVPWQAAFESIRLLNSKKKNHNRFVLGASGHIAGVINPPVKKKRSYWINDKPVTDADEWLRGAAEHPGSWWTEWIAFLAKSAGKQVPAPKKYGNAKYKSIEPAPGRYVNVKAE